MDCNNPAVKLCAEGMRAEGEGRLEDARGLYERAWTGRKDDFEACVAVHYLARQQPAAEETFRWNKEALERADAAGAAGDGRVEGFYSSLYLNMGKSHEDLGDLNQARKCYEKAKDLPDDGYRNLVKRGSASGLGRVGYPEEDGAS